MTKEYKNLLDLIGMTPLVQINHLNPHKKVRILAKLESFNPGGSVKDRPARQMIEEIRALGKKYGKMSMEELFEIVSNSPMQGIID